MQRSTDVHIICNPTAGKGRAERLLPQVQRLLHSDGFHAHVTRTDSPGHATTLAAELSAEHVLVLGGDGTLNEVVNGLGNTRATIGILPAGSGNDFCKMLGFRTPEDTVRALITGSRSAMDLAHVDVVDEDEQIHSRHFINTMGIGFDAAVAIEFSRSRFGSGVLPYLLAVFRTLRSYASVPARVSCMNSEINGQLFLCSIGNGSTSGGGFRLTPEALPDDGLLDLCHVSHARIPRVLRVLPKAMSGKHISEAEVTTARAAHFTIELSYPLPVHVDGEILTRTARRVVVTVRPAALQFYHTPKSREQTA